MSFNPTALRPRLQTEFYEFLEQKLLSVESQLSTSEKERKELGVALTQTEKKLEASNAELKELRANAGAPVEVPPNKDETESTESLKNDLQQVSDLLARERARREEAERVTSETEAKVKTLADECAQSKSTYREDLVNKEETCSRAVAERVEAIAAETKCRQQLNNVKAELDAAKKEVSRLSTANHSTQSPADKLEHHSSVKVSHRTL
ncbi:uncharacterized protein B0H18DRAFT_1041445 [Fomitopsis serialis]|uniref:uncharacterized protein n=1 Tax=Fomitopsis serialis TaxID=139415 RepID=UPI00200828C5|nr:uncharacterized protein B0H18DRAFT_1041445 [Neoantrodia serialis]KAH9915491.1 hypothetical protein B0H18DRAFT_1041445 [Neoantrodia serialis]